MVKAVAATPQQGYGTNGVQSTQQEAQQCQQQQHHKKQQDRAELLHLVAGLVSTVLWCLASSTLIVINNSLYKGGFPYPMMVTGIGQVFSAATGLLLSAVGVLPLSRGPPRTPSEILPVTLLAACTAGTMFLGNAPYMHLSLSFIQILKAFTPALTLVVGTLAGVERLTGALVLSVLLIAVGTGGAILAESGATSYSLYGLVLFMGSSITEAARVVVSQLLLGPHKYNSSGVLVYVGIPTASLLVGGSLLLERQHGLFTDFETIMAVNPWIFIKAGVVSSLVNLTSYLAISTTSSLTFKVSGCLKNLGVVWYGVATHGDVVTLRHMLGYGLSLAGFVIYSYSRQANAVTVVKAKAS